MTTQPPGPRSAPAPRPEAAPDVVLPAQLFAGLGQGFLVLDEAGTVLQATGTAADLLATTPSALVGLHCPLHPPRPRAHAAPVSPSAVAGEGDVTRTASPFLRTGVPGQIATTAMGWFAPEPTPEPTPVPVPAPREATGRAAERRPPATAQRWTHRVSLPGGAVRRLLITSTPLPGGRALSLVDITDVHAEEATRQDVAAARNLAELSLWEYHLDTDELVLSPQLLAVLGLPDGVRVDLDTFRSWLDAEDGDVLRRLKREALAGHSTWRLLLRVTPPDGRPRYLRHWCYLGLDGARAPMTIAGACLDVTDGGAAAEELRTSRRRLQAAVRLTGLASWSMRVDGSHVWWSEGMFALFGKDPAAFSPGPQEHFDLTHPADLPPLLSCLDRVLATGVPDEIDLRVITPAGVRHLRCWIDVTVDDDLQQTVLGTALDVTEQARTLRALQAQREEFRLAFHAAPIGMAVLFVDGDGRRTVRRVNPELRELLGLPDGELTDAQLVTHFPPEDRRRHGRALRELCSGAVAETDYEVSYLRLDGSTGHLWVRAGIARDVPGRPGGRMQILYHVLDVTQRERDRRELQKLAMTDPLTGLANRAMFSVRLEDVLTAPTKESPGAALVLVDLDRFKAINDTLGHVAGDRLLVEVAKRLRSASPAGALVARLGGDEFAVLVPHRLGEHDLMRVGERIRLALAVPHRLDVPQDVLCTATIGAADLSAGQVRPADAYREADLALYAAKAAGRNAVVVADERLRGQLRRQQRMERSISEALEGDRLRIAWQPAVDLATGLVVGHEALARLDDGDGQVLMPEAFLPVAEEMGAVTELDCRITEMAVEHLADVAEGYVAVNVSTRTLGQGGYVERVREVLERFGVAPQRLLIELDETSLLADGDGEHPAQRAVRALDQLGVRIGLDDFGTGYSALAHLERYPLDFLKLDHTFVARLGSSPTAEQLVRAVVGLAHGYGMVVTAEGVETQEQVETLRRVGCDRAQGWLFDANPRPKDGVPGPHVWRTA